MIHLADHAGYAGYAGYGEYLLWGAMALLMGHVLVRDIRAMEIPALPVLVLAALGGVAGLAFPAPGAGPLEAVVGGALGAGLGFATRAYAIWRSGVAAFGGADIALITGAGAMLGPFLLGPWILAVVTAAFGLGLAVPRLFGRRRRDLDGAELEVLPLCPALILGWAGAAALLETGVVPATGMF